MSSTRKIARLPTRAIGALVRAGDPDAIAYVRATLRSTGGAVSTAAAEIGVDRKTLVAWLALPALADVERLDRGGAARRAREGRR